MDQKQKYRIRNWSNYNTSLVNRGNICIWIDEKAIQSWSAQKLKNKTGRPFIYSDDAVTTALILKNTFNLPFRAAEGFIKSIFQMMQVHLPVPCYTQVCRRSKKMNIQLKKLKNVRHIVIDSTGLKVYGEGEWKVRKYGPGRRRTWKKLHLGVDSDSGQIVSWELTDNNIADCSMFSELIKDAPKGIRKCFADGAYDTESCYRVCHEHEIQPMIPPRKGAVYDSNSPPHLQSRNNAIAEIVGFGADEDARKLWKKCSGYHERSLAETMMYRLKCVLGQKLKSRLESTQKTEAGIKCMILNRMTELGMPSGAWMTV